MTMITKPMTPPSTETMMTVKVLSTSFTEKRERGKYIGREIEKHREMQRKLLCLSEGISTVKGLD